MRVWVQQGRWVSLTATEWRVRWSSNATKDLATVFKWPYPEGIASIAIHI